MTSFLKIILTVFPYVKEGNMATVFHISHATCLDMKNVNTVKKITFLSSRPGEE